MRVLQDEPLAFLVNLGDFAGNPTPAEHHFVIAEMATEMLTPYPIFLVPGNHDVGGTGFTTADFERCYGPHQFAFRYGPDLFVILRYIRGQPTGPAETFLNTVLERERASARHVFVFMHTPLGVSPAFAKAGGPPSTSGAPTGGSTMRSSWTSGRTASASPFCAFRTRSPSRTGWSCGPLSARAPGWSAPGTWRRWWLARGCW